MKGNVYLIHFREFKNLGQQTYYVQVSKKDFLEITRTIPKNSNIVLMDPINDTKKAKKEINSRLKERFINDFEKYGKNHYTGNMYEIKKEISKTIQELGL
jgi:hypothetical protein